MAAPTVSAVAPVTGPVLGGTQVTITGTGYFNGGAASAVSAVTFGATPAVRFNVASDTSLTAVVPAHAAGTVDVTVTTPGGTSSTGAPDEFTFGPTVATQQPGPPGSVITFQAGNGVSESFVGDGLTELRIAVTGATGATATIVAKTPCSQGHLHNQVIGVAGNTQETAGPFSTNQYTDPATGWTFVTYNDATNVTVAAVRIA